jgi:SAM-dependent methyltransferase
MDESVYQRIKLNSNNHWWFRARILIFDTIIEGLVKRNKIKILDYGSGIGVNINMLKNYGVVDAVEPHYKTAKYIKKKFKINVIKKANKKYDLIILTDVIEHIKNDKKKIKELINTLKKNGYLFITAPAFQILFSKKDEDLHHYRRYNKSGLKKILPQKKVEIIKISYFNFFLFPLIAFIILILKFFNVNFINKVEKSPPFIINYILFKIFVFEKYLLKRINFPFGLSLLMIVKKK